jgi:hypothetical protein
MLLAVVTVLIAWLTVSPSATALALSRRDFLRNMYLLRQVRILLFNAHQWDACIRGTFPHRLSLYRPEGSLHEANTY